MSLKKKKVTLQNQEISMEITKSIISQECWLKNETHDVSVSTIILKIDDTNLNKKGMGDNLHLKELSKEHFFIWQLKED